MGIVFQRFRINSDARGRLATFTLLIVSVMVPTLCMIWLIGRAANNEHLALKQALTDARLREAVLIRNQVALTTEEWRESIISWFEETPHLSLSAVVGRGFGESIIVEENNEPVSGIQGLDRSSYQLLGEIHYLSKSIGKEAAIAQIRSLLHHEFSEDIYLENGSVLQPYLMLMGIEFALDTSVDAMDLYALLLPYLRGEPGKLLLADQRRFLLHELAAIGMSSAEMDLYRETEDLAADWFMNNGKMVTLTGGDGFRVHKGIVYEHFPEYGATLLMRVDVFETYLLKSLTTGSQFDSIVPTLLIPGMITAGDPVDFEIFDLAYPLEGWRLKIDYPEILDNKYASATRHIFVYIWVGSLTILISVFMVFLSMGLLRRQMTMAQLKNDLVATVSHELKTPIASIRLLVETLLDDPDAGLEQTKDYLQLINNENRRLGHLVQKFLTFSKMKRGESYFDFEKVNPAEIIEEVEEAFRERFSNNDYQLDVTCARNITPLRADRETLVLAISNLLENAYKYSGGEKKLRLECSEESVFVEFKVEDNGQGISKFERKRIFQKFYQLDRSLNNHKGGVGLGLSIVSFVVDKHKGEVVVESELGEGSSFKIRIPHA